MQLIKNNSLQLEHYHFTECVVVARDVEFDDIQVEGPYPSFSNLKLNSTVNIATPEEDENPNNFLLSLDVECVPEESSSFPYVFKFRVEGIFECSFPENDTEERKRFVVSNGSTMLYGAVREVLINLTSRQKYGPVLLPTTSFANMQPAE
ncbi:hypothetical protein PAJ_0758 [Pantoea ananatis AJ13355]|uniref:Preprotein translocase subunit SecB n=1 Tax=Pantoea ananatis (strain AJ13355) TaxID=932677 RepID=A0A0H3KUH2_PANAA|nr:protein-export chaperone SecB [Pantoea ananatis]BAK10838.1 hypothetical protein PAJ_0758 [Pantoea ananatis AJ13355]